jgi:hypothetical protein
MDAAINVTASGLGDLMCFMIGNQVGVRCYSAWQNPPSCTIVDCI